MKMLDWRNQEFELNHEASKVLIGKINSFVAAIYCLVSTNKCFLESICLKSTRYLTKRLLSKHYNKRMSKIKNASQGGGKKRPEGRKLEKLNPLLQIGMREKIFS